tara:strand:+ start:1100 stop:1279 length:180 start_codon:yes stop_codon:yes gene_type:complete
MSEKTKMDRENARMKLFCDVYVSLANHDTAGAIKAKQWARSAVKDFDEQFPLDEGKEGS